MAIEKHVDYSHLIGRPDLKNGQVDFGMKVTYPFEQTVFLTDEVFELQRAYLETPKEMRRTFVIGTMTGLLVPELRRLPDYYIALIRSVHGVYDRVGIDSYSCFLREKMGEVGITDEQATVLDKLALETSDFLTVLPGASKSEGTLKEIAHGTKVGIDLVCLLNEDNPEDMEFRTGIMGFAAVHGAKSNLTFITFKKQVDLEEQLEEVTRDLAA